MGVASKKIAPKNSTQNFGGNNARRIGDRTLLGVLSGGLIPIGGIRIVKWGLDGWIRGGRGAMGGVDVGSVLALGQQVANLCQKLGFRGCCFFLRDALALRVKFSDLVHRHDQHKVDDSCDDEEVDRRGDDRTEVDERRFHALAQVKAESFDVWVRANRCDERIDDLITR